MDRLWVGCIVTLRPLSLTNSQVSSITGSHFTPELSQLNPDFYPRYKLGLDSTPELSQLNQDSHPQESYAMRVASGKIPSDLRMKFPCLK